MEGWFIGISAIILFIYAADDMLSMSYLRNEWYSELCSRRNSTGPEGPAEVYLKRLCDTLQIEWYVLQGQMILYNRYHLFRSSGHMDLLMHFPHIYKKYFTTYFGYHHQIAKRSSHGRVAEDVKIPMFMEGFYVWWHLRETIGKKDGWHLMMMIPDRYAYNSFD